MASDILNKVSIRLMSGGHTFSKSDIEALKRAGAGAVVEIVTHKTVLRPEQGFDAAKANDDLAAIGCVVEDDEVVVYDDGEEKNVGLASLLSAFGINPDD